MQNYFEMVRDTVSQSSVSSVFRCKLCNKPFAKQTVTVESTLKRHGYYCRSRTIGNATRLRSCISCVKAKTRCDATRPACFRCSIKGIDCQYPAKIARTSSSSKQTQSDEDAPLTLDFYAQDSPSYSNEPSHHFALDNLFSNSQELLPASNEWESLDWSDLIQSQTTLDSSSPEMLTNSNKISLLDNLLNMPEATASSKSPILRMPTFLMSSILPRPHTDNASQRISHLILQTLKSYPLMILRQKIPPPFIHPQLRIESEANDDFEPWHNCMSLMHMMDSDIQGRRKLFWRNVRSECELFCEEYVSFNKWQLLSAMQALAIYTIVRLGEDEVDCRYCDMPLVRAVTMISTQLMAIDTTSRFLPPNIISLETQWKDWILEESRRRLCVMFQIINMLVYWEPAARCKTKGEIIMAPLPAQKQLWEASDESSWKQQDMAESQVQREFGLTKNGLLIKLDDNTNCHTLRAESESRMLSNGTAKWDEWCSQMDGIGGLVMLAAYLVQ